MVKIIRTTYITHQKEKEQGMVATIPKSILGIDVKNILSKIERKYHVRLPRKVLALDYGKRGDLCIRFKYVEKPIGESTKDGLIIFFYDDGKVVGVEVMDISKI